MVLKVCVAGATGWAGSELARSIAGTEDLTLVAAVGRRHAGRILGEVLGDPRLTCRVYASAAEALSEPCDVVVEYTKPDSARTNILAALERGAHVVVGTSGLTENDFAQIDDFARRQNCGVLACGNFALTAVLLQKFAEVAARLIPSGRSSSTRTTTRSTHRAVLPASLRIACRLCGARSLRFPWRRRSVRERCAARPSPAHRCIRFACPVT